MRWAGLWLVALGACSGAEVAAHPPPVHKETKPDLCTAVEACQGGEDCDPDSGTCTCAGAICTPAQTCVEGRCTDLCEGVVCGFGLGCDPLVGACRCDGASCSDTQVCADGHCVDHDRCAPPFAPDCGSSGICVRGTCVCGDGPSCPDDSTCVDSVCVFNVCLYATCPINTRCGSDGACHCDSSNGVDPGQGPICPEDKVCVPDWGQCIDVECANIECPPGTVCDLTPPSLGTLCRCGGIGPSHPVCLPGMSCDLQTGTCVAPTTWCGVDCEKTSPGTTCDPEDGFCKCGGQGGTRCQLGDACVTGGDVPICAAECDPLDPSACIGCTFDGTLDVSVCLSPGIGREGDGCSAPDGCAAGMACAPSATGTRVCVIMCARDQPGSCPDGGLCVGLDNSPGSNLGWCYRP